MQKQKWNELDELIMVIILQCYKIIFVMKISDNWEFWGEKKWYLIFIEHLYIVKINNKTNLIFF